MNYIKKRYRIFWVPVILVSLILFTISKIWDFLMNGMIPGQDITVDIDFFNGVPRKVYKKDGQEFIGESLSMGVEQKPTDEDKFRSFLRIDDCYGSFIANMHNHGKYSSLKELNSATTPLNFISIAFLWDDTKEGYCYWEDVHSRWIKFLNIQS